MTDGKGRRDFAVENRRELENLGSVDRKEIMKAAYGAVAGFPVTSGGLVLQPNR